ncbi:endonuclease/exonuclease/phosphatase family protein, partial [Trifolium pratense]
MSIISWNCRGLGNLSSVPKFKYLIRYYNPDAIFLCETLVHRNKIEELRILLGFENCFAVDREGRGGGVALLWKSTIHCNITNYSSNHINVEIDDAHRGTWRLTGFYGYPGGSRRRDSWNFLRRLSQSSQLPWCIIGDFNDILDAIEKKGRSERPNWLINGFRQAVLDSGLSDVHMDGYPFTWFKSLGTPRAVEERLDRALANEAWFQLFPNAKLENLVAPASDHYPILLDRDPIIRSCRARRKFKFENAWCIETELDDVVHRSWLSTLERPIMPRLEVCAEDLSQWSKNHCHNLKKEIEDCRKKLQHARDQGSVSNANYVNALRKRMTHLLVQDDLFWRQRAKNHWYRDGDLNTRFFHASATSRRKVNRISYLKDDSGLRTTDISGMCNLAKNYFDELFQKQASTRGPVISTIMPTIFDDDNEKLTSPFKIEEFKEALFSMHSD